MAVDTCRLDYCNKPRGETLCPAHRRQQRHGEELRPLRPYMKRPQFATWAEYHKWRVREFRERVAAIKVERGCVDCGYNVHPDALEFDHLPGVAKSYKVSARRSGSWQRVLDEIAKCEVVCANCHRIRTRRRAGWDHDWYALLKE